ncbi:hypothetical protein D3C81_1534560 [compost metagenome]
MSTRFSFSQNACSLSSASFSLVRSSSMRVFIQLVAVMDISMVASSWPSMKPLAMALAALAAMRGSAISTCNWTSWLLPSGAMLTRFMKVLVTSSKIFASVGSTPSSRSSGRMTGMASPMLKLASRPPMSISGSGCWRGSNSGCVVRFNFLTTRSARARDLSSSNWVSRYSLPIPSGS